MTVGDDHFGGRLGHRCRLRHGRGGRRGLRGRDHDRDCGRGRGWLLGCRRLRGRGWLRGCRRLRGRVWLRRCRRWRRRWRGDRRRPGGWDWRWLRDGRSLRLGNRRAQGRWRGTRSGDRVRCRWCRRRRCGGRRNRRRRGAWSGRHRRRFGARDHAGHGHIRHRRRRNLGCDNWLSDGPYADRNPREDQVGDPQGDDEAGALGGRHNDGGTPLTGDAVPPQSPSW